MTTAQNGLASTRAPIAVFAYRRANHLSATLDALEKCEGFADSPVIIFSDGPRSEREAEDVAKVRKLIRSRLRPNIKMIERERNFGLAASIIDGVTGLCNEYGRVIVLEDDLVVSPSTLRWFNNCLDFYEDEHRVMAISGYQFFIPSLRKQKFGIFARFSSSWGWATWNRAWIKFDPEAAGWEELLENHALANDFDWNGSYPLSRMLLSQMTGSVDSWAIRWAWTIFRQQGLSVFPPRSLVRNSGFDTKATHNTIGWLKILSRGRNPLMWLEKHPPRPPQFAFPTNADVTAFRGGLYATNSMRNLRIKQLLGSVKD